MLFSRRSLLVGVPALFLFSACATAPVHRTDEQLRQAFSEVCAIGRDHQEVTGTVWMKVETPQEKGQFPAQLRAQNPDGLDLEITNLVGGVEGTLKIHDGHFEVRRAGQKKVQQKGSGNWEGIPLHWAVDLFLGRIPCPVMNGSGRAERIELSQTDHGDLVATAIYGAGRAKEEFVYVLKNWGGKSWPTHLSWNKKSASIDVEFDQPADLDASPLKWMAVSKSSEVSIRWKERKVSP
jgi:hypothetical protein